MIPARARRREIHKKPFLISLCRKRDEEPLGKPEKAEKAESQSKYPNSRADRFLF